jgi:hypothetical protein
LPRSASTLGALQKFTNQLGRFPYDASALQPLIPVVEDFHLFAVSPIHMDNLPAGNSSVPFDDLIPETIEKLMSAGPHSGVFLFFLAAAAESKPNGRKPPHQRSTDSSVSPQSSSECSQGPDDFVPASAQFFLPDRKNSLASMESLQHEFYRFFLHFFRRQSVLLFQESIGVSVGIPQKPTRLASFFM